MKQKYSKAWSTRRTPGVFSVFSLLQSLKSCCTDIQREEITRAALGEKAVRVPSAFVMLLKAGSHATRAVGKAQRGGKLAWKKSSEVSFHRDTVFSGGTEGQCLSVFTPMGTRPVAGLSKDQREIGTVPITAIDAGVVLAS